MTDGAAATAAARSSGRVAVAPALGVAAIWLFLLVFLVYPLLRIFWDAFTDVVGRFTVGHFVE
ncbi:MAG: hypothetical protein ACREJV_10840, partial [Candidatus Rokuibacteriota bacterium]